MLVRSYSDCQHNQDCDVGKEFLQDKVALNKTVSLQCVANREGTLLHCFFTEVLWLHWGSDQNGWEVGKEWDSADAADP